MAYIPLNLGRLDSSVAAAISMATEQHLEQAHYLLAATYARDLPHQHFGRSAVTMTLLAIAAASAIRRFDSRKNKNSAGDRKSFICCVRSYLPWSDVTIVDAKHRNEDAKLDAAAMQLYEVFRNPLVHSGGITGKAHVRAEFCHTFPGRETFEENESAIVELCHVTSLRSTLIEMPAESSRLYTRPLYWCARRMIEAFAADPAVQNDIRTNIGC